MLLLFALLLSPCTRLLSAQDDPKSNLEKDRALQVAFESALTRNLDAARRYLPLVIDKPWIAETDFRAACALARTIQETPADALDSASAEKLVLAAGLRNPSLALREGDRYLPLTAGTRLFERFVLAAPDQAMGLASGTSRWAQKARDLLSASNSPVLTLLARLAQDPAVDLPRRGRVAILAGRISRGELSFQAALQIADSTPQFFATVLDMRAAGADPALDRALQNESLVLCQAAQENLDGVLTSDLAHFRAIDLYAVLALGRAEANPPVFRAVFDRLLLPKWKAEKPKGTSFTDFLDRTKNWELRDFTAGALAAGRFDSLLSFDGSDVVSRLARGVDRSTDPLKEAMRLAEIIDAVASPALRDRIAAIVSGEFSRCSQAGDLRGKTLYGLLAARLANNLNSAIAAPYLPFLKSSQTLDTALLFGADNDCIERYFFYDDDDGVESFESFRATYRHDPAWEIEDRGEYLHLIGHGPDGRRIEIFANVPVDTHQPKNRALEGESERRQSIIAAALDERRLVATVIVHRGHSFWVERTLTYLAKSTRLVILGSCGGTTEIHQVIEASHDAQVIATRGIGETEINDGILKAVNDRILTGAPTILWDAFWRDLENRWGNSAFFRDYVSPDQDAGTVLLRAYHRFLDALN
jgi:hypothetical protein